MRQKGVLALSVMVLIIVTYVLVLPALALDVDRAKEMAGTNESVSAEPAGPMSRFSAN